MNTRWKWLIAAAMVWPAGVAAQTPVAVVEQAAGKVGVEFMDYVTAGQVIDLGRDGSVVLSYMKSCVRETITGGTVIALEEESLVQGGKVERSRPRCDAKRLQLDARRATQSAGTVYRGGPTLSAQADSAPLVLYGRSPMVQIDDIRSPLLISRLDQAEPAQQFAITDRLLVADKFADFAKAGIVLAAGGRYRASQGSAAVEFVIDADAAAGQTAVIGRLLRLR
ncbi:hypothetical protein [Piscinibacter sakaiensis]|uniref:hypothetical protein n=1 Tax=Piscinibacter sakaiensis TaxID=1547922 RepID=UPI003AAEF7D6